jgi:hypothetical protein
MLQNISSSMINAARSIIQDTLLKKVSGIKSQATSYQDTSYKRSRYKLILSKSQANGSGTTVQDTSDNIWLPS